MPNITLLPENRILEAAAGADLHGILREAGVILDAPCGGQGTCGKCKVLVEGKAVLACRTVIDRDLTVTLPKAVAGQRQLREGSSAAFDIGTTTVVCYLLDGRGAVVAEASARNPQVSFGADVISRIRAAQAGQGEVMTGLIRNTMTDLLEQLCSDPENLTTVCVVGNPAMQQLFLGLPLHNLAQLPFAPVLTKGETLPCRDYLPVCSNAALLTVPDISGFVGADTVAGVLSCGLQEEEAVALLVDIGTNGEMVLGNRHRAIACSTAAGPALEGASITCGMRAESGAIDRVWLENGQLCCHVMGEGEATGICGSGLIDALAAALELGLVNRRGRIREKIMLTDKVYLTQEDIRQVQLAKGAICAGILLMTRQYGVTLEEIQSVKLAGAFGSFLNPESACRIGLLPEVLLEKITAAGNAAGMGAVQMAATPEKRTVAEEIAGKTEFLELASLPQFPKTFAKAMEFREDWRLAAKKAGFTHAAAFDPAVLQGRADVRDMCAQDKCHAYGKNWTCPPHCGTLEACQESMHSYKHGILLQTVGQLAKDIDSRGYRETEQRHLAAFMVFCESIRRAYPNALCLGTGGCRICKTCAYPEPCRFPEQAVSSMEGYGLFVTQVCRDAGLHYYHGERTITYTACVLYG